ncbi:lipopolysaccharide biosynthesis protein [Sphingobacterium alkalisoli]|uniref:Lipopolysaccharide biosynthesis protein n=1 Tax=Sphingobacterium alkalisoli TaxID=1874115 RepID=A0A4U0H848_9SPHI|nr:lipopolysaccharide biosynthesis protein [Sphingobacterium alkalisoli]TJY68043.1 lipopolysaccharide biosynthesis protein [Sphingobacterium alkalisoli]GGH09454.1 lipopolysaccharide biosynthesis protein [Sphingobacterium alkalisoli]
MSNNTKEVTIKGLFWNAVDRFGNQFIVTIVGVVTARIIAPEDFGILGVLMIFSTVATSFVDSGLATSLVRSKELNKIDYSTMFVFNLLTSFVIYFILFFCSPMIERLNKIDGLSFYARVMFLQIIVHSFGIVQYVQILKSFQFNITARINILSIFLSGTITILISVFGYGIWALLLQPVFYSFFRTVFLWIWGKWDISLVFSIKSLRKHLKFSILFMFSNMINKILSPLYYSILGTNYPLSTTGFYYQANKWGETPNLLISSIIQGTTLSTLAPIQDDFDRFLNACRKTMATLAFVLFPVSICFIVIAQPGFALFLTETWTPSVIYFQIICFAGIFISLSDLNVSFLNIKGKSTYAFNLEFTKLALAIIILAFTYNKGVLNILYGQLCVRIVCYIIVTFFSEKIYGYNFFKQMKDILSSFCASLVCALLAFIPAYADFNITNSNLLVIQVIIFVSGYCLINHFSRNTIWTELMAIVKTRFNKNRNGID